MVSREPSFGNVLVASHSLDVKDTRCNWFSTQVIVSSQTGISWWLAPKVFQWQILCFGHLECISWQKKLLKKLGKKVYWRKRSILVLVRYISLSQITRGQDKTWKISMNGQLSLESRVSSLWWNKFRGERQNGIWIILLLLLHEVGLGLLETHHNLDHHPENWYHLQLWVQEIEQGFHTLSSASLKFK